MNIAIILAGGVGKRMGLHIPKQFVRVNGKPILVYTLEAFEQSPLIDAIEVVCVDGWQNTVKTLGQKYKITKLNWIVNWG